MVDAFKILNLEFFFDLDLDQLEKNYIFESAQWHPDLEPRASSRKKLERTMHMANLNAAYEILKNPLSRGYHLLCYLAPDLNADQEKTIKDPNLLMEVMEDQESLEKIITLEEGELFQRKAQKKCDKIYFLISKNFMEKKYQEALLNLYGYRYYQKNLKDAMTKCRQFSVKDNHAASA